MSTGKLVTKSELIEIITAKQKHLPAKDVELALKQILEIMSDALSQGERIRNSGFRPVSPCTSGRLARDATPKTGEAVACRASTSRISSREGLRERVNDGADRAHPGLTRIAL